MSYIGLVRGSVGLTTGLRVPAEAGGFAYREVSSDLAGSEDVFIMEAESCLVIARAMAERTAHTGKPSGFRDGESGGFIIQDGEFIVAVHSTDGRFDEAIAAGGCYLATAYCNRSV